MKVEVIQVKAEPETVKKLQVDVSRLQQDGLNNQLVIDKLQSDLVAQQKGLTDLDERVEIIEGLVIP